MINVAIDGPAGAGKSTIIVLRLMDQQEQEKARLQKQLQRN